MKFSGEVVHGQGIGREYGYPTANMNKRVQDVALETGIYAGQAVLHNNTYGAAIIAKTPKDQIEVYLIGYDGGEFYGEEMIAQVYEKVGEYVHAFQDVDQLKRKIEGDLQAVIEYLQIRKK
ncbi:riboflavin kinase [Candidatus Nomurabacteria bacterium]|nr:riboflavin kinase [Candidatus Nomurabacteria bacterium]